MATLVLLAFLIGSGICRPTDSDYSEYVYEVYNASSSQGDSLEWSFPEEDIVLTKRDLVVTKDNTTANLTSEQTFLLADVISKVEGSLVQTAFDIVSVLQKHNQTADASVKGDEGGETKEISKETSEERKPHPLFMNISARSNSDDSHMIAHNDKNDGIKEDRKIDEEEVTHLESGDTSRQRRSVSTTTIPYSPNPDDVQKSTTTTPVTFSTKDTISVTSSTTKTPEHDHSTTNGKEPLSSTTSAGSSTPSSHPITASTTLQPAKSVSISTSLPISEVTTTKATTTTKNPVKELKETEKEVKAKVAEIEAEPIILSSRV